MARSILLNPTVHYGPWHMTKSSDMANGAEIVTDFYCMASLFIGIVVNVVNQHVREKLLRTNSTVHSILA
jgi:hypothetical protein